MDKTLLNLEHQIAAFVNSDNKSGCTVHFDYGQATSDDSIFKTAPTGDWTATVETFNPTTDETFLLRSETAPTKEKALKKIMDYLKKQKGESPFTVKWVKRGENSVTPKLSYFYCHDIQDVVDNFFHGKNPEEYIVHEIKLNPIS